MDLSPGRGVLRNIIMHILFVIRASGATSAPTELYRDGPPKGHQTGSNFQRMVTASRPETPEPFECLVFKPLPRYLLPSVVGKLRVPLD